MPAIELDLRRDLPKIRAAIAAKSLQVYTEPKAPCLYVGPCAIGICVTPEQREYLDNCGPTCGDSPTISKLLEREEVIAAANQEYDLGELQGCHDNGDIKNFEAFVTKLEKKYLRP